ncbi:hypothetical protein N9N67_01290 [Bacteriovoracaceae bacterium]|nr:hypothetical protein [Bacteriovoracaceae bacterium]
MWTKSKQKNCQRENSYTISFDRPDFMHEIWVNLTIVYGPSKKLDSYECEEINHKKFSLRWFHTDAKFTLIEHDGFDQELEDQLHLIFDNNEANKAA